MKPVAYCPKCEQWHRNDVTCPKHGAESLGLIIIGAVVLVIVLGLIWLIT